MIGVKLKEIREKTGMNKKEFADYIGIKYTTYNNYETEAREPASDFLILISTKFDVSIDYLLGMQDTKDITHAYQLKSSEFEHIKKYRSLDTYGRETVSYILDREIERTRQLNNAYTDSRSGIIDRVTCYKNYYQHLASAGTGEYIFDDVPTDTLEVPVNELSERADFIIGVNGNSMEPTYYDGDKVYVEKCQVVETGDIGIFMVNNECFIKEAGENGLISHNKKYPIIPGSKHIICVGKVLGKVE